jgi:site-specific DNA-methyltransferase (adenine-specific)
LRDYKVDGQLGHENTVQEYIEKLVTIFDECKRVLKSSGTCWVVMGDSYNGNKSLSLVPDRFAIEMTNREWILRNTIIWFKSNCMPSSAKDRFTVDFENIYFFTKSPKYYFKTQYEPHLSNGSGKADRKSGSKNLDESKGQSAHSFHKAGYIFEYAPVGRIKRCVWKIATKPFTETHFAVFPPELVKQCLDAGCPPNGTTLDPFIGSGTVALVALKNAMNFVGIELNPDYIKMAQKRIEPYLKQEKLTQFTR